LHVVIALMRVPADACPLQKQGYMSTRTCNPGTTFFYREGPISRG